MQNPSEISSNGLHDLIKSSYKRNNEAEELGARNGYRLDHKLSNSEHKVFVDPDNNSTVVFAGSRKAGDWLITNPAVAVGLGKMTPRYDASQKVVNEAKNKYNGKVTTIGHSVGGWLSENVNNADKKYTVNKAVGLGDVGKTVRKNQTDIIVNNDIISPLTYTQKHKGKLIKIKNKNINPLVAHNYKHLKKINI